MPIPTIIYNGEVKDGILKIHNRKLFDKELSTLEGEVTITIKKKKKVRSPQANKYYWGVVISLIVHGFEQTGVQTTKEVVHEFLKLRFNFDEVVSESTGEVIKIAKTTTNMSTMEFSEDYTERCREFAREFFNIEIPEPGTQTEIEII